MSTSIGWVDATTDSGYAESSLKGVSYMRVDIQEMAFSSDCLLRYTARDDKSLHRFMVTINQYGLWDNSHVGDEYYKSMEDAKKAAEAALRKTQQQLTNFVRG